MAKRQTTLISPFTFGTRCSSCRLILQTIPLSPPSGDTLYKFYGVVLCEYGRDTLQGHSGGTLKNEASYGAKP